MSLEFGVLIEAEGRCQLREFPDGFEEPFLGRDAVAAEEAAVGRKTYLIVLVHAQTFTFSAPDIDYDSITKIATALRHEHRPPGGQVLGYGCRYIPIVT